MTHLCLPVQLMFWWSAPLHIFLHSLQELAASSLLKVARLCILCTKRLNKNRLANQEATETITAGGKREPGGEERRRRGRERKEGGYSTITLRMCVCVCAASVFLTPGWTVYYLQPRDYSATLKASDLTREHDP